MATSNVGLGSRLDAIELLEKMPPDFRIETGLRPLLNSDDLEVRLRTAEALAMRDDPIIKKYSVDNKFDLLLVPSDHNMVYVTQTGWPKIMLTGNIEIERPLTLSTWSNTLLVKEDPDDSEMLEVRYRDTERQKTLKEQVAPDLPRFTVFLAHQTTPESPAPGLNLSYSRTIGAIHSLWREQYLNADFKVEQDRLLSAIQRLASETTYTPRPDYGDGFSLEEESRFIDSSPPTIAEEQNSSP
jgi:hypothetical protein